MWAIDTACPEFRVRTPAGVVGPTELRPGWVALLHCTRPCTAGCSACLDGFDRLGQRLGERGCRLVVALDEPDAQLRALLGRMPGDARAPVLIGTWETPEPPHAPQTLFAVIDPTGTVRALLEGSNATPLPGRSLLEVVDRALGRAPAAAVGRAVAPADAFGCVAWFDYDAPAKRTPSGP
jgi:hypothetical protein